MSTTVKYKGNTIATVDNETKKLTTKGTWLEDDIEIKDVSSGGGGQTVYTSSTGLLYTPRMTIDLAMERSTGYEVSTILSRYGSMPYLEELTLTGTFRRSTTGAMLPSAGTFETNYPMLKKLYIQPTEALSGSGSPLDPSHAEYNTIKAGHYVFKNTNLTDLVLGKLNGPYWIGGGYFGTPTDMGTNVIGSKDGLKLTIYTDVYRDYGGFMKGGDLASTTVYKCLNYLTGEELTP